MYDQAVQHVLTDLYRIVDAGEKGFATSAADMPNPGIKLLLKTYARQRARFKEEIQAELSGAGAHGSPGSSIPGMIHRGRVAIIAALVIEEDWRERIILTETALGEKESLRTYTRIQRMNLPAPIQEMVERQAGEVAKVSETIAMLRKRDDQSILMRLYDSEKNAEEVVQLLTSAGFSQDQIDEVRLGETDPHPSRGITPAETFLSGSMGGALWGGLMGIVAGYGVSQSIAPDPFGATVNIYFWVLTAIGFLLTGSLLVGLLGLFIGMGIGDNGNSASRSLINSSLVILRIPNENTRAHEARQIMDQFRSPLNAPRATAR